MRKKIITLRLDCKSILNVSSPTYIAIAASGDAANDSFCCSGGGGGGDRSTWQTMALLTSGGTDWALIGKEKGRKEVVYTYVRQKLPANRKHICGYIRNKFSSSNIYTMSNIFVKSVYMYKALAAFDGSGTNFSPFLSSQGLKPVSLPHDKLTDTAGDFWTAN